MADIEHKALPDELLHEPKGASTAAAGTVYVANGNGAGTFQKVELKDIDFTREYVEGLGAPVNIPANTAITRGMPNTSDGHLELIASDVLKVDTINQLNKNFSELYTFIEQQNKINTQLTNQLDYIYKKFQQAVSVLKSEGLVA